MTTDARTTRPTNADIYEKVTADIVAAMEAGNIPWEKPWIGGGAPCNAITGRHYSGCNVWSLSLAGWSKGYTSRGWLTFNQARKAGVMVEKGQKATPVFYMNRIAKRQTPAEKAAGDEPQSLFVARLFYVFNLDQVKDVKPGSLAKIRTRLDGITACEAFNPVAECEDVVTRSGAVVKHEGNQACYCPSSDEIRMPSPESFRKGAAGYYPVLFHELTHWTGHESRLNRELKNGFGSPAYAFEELVAELSAAFMSHRAGFDHVSQSAAYLQNWLKALKENKGAFVTAARLAQAAASYLWPLPEVSAAETDDETAETMGQAA